jgi:uncharacterized surface protein with fasciclin (FAS1) repeats
MRMLTAKIVAVLLAASVTQASANDRNIVQVAAQAKTFGTLLAAATAAGFADELSQVDGLTVFAPNDAAFAKLPAGTVADLLLPANKDKLRAIIAYHIVPGRVFAHQIPVRPALVETLNGCERVKTSRTGRSQRGGMVKVDDANVIAADVKASNGVIHVIDSVLIPARACP